MITKGAQGDRMWSSHPRGRSRHAMINLRNPGLEDAQTALGSVTGFRRTFLKQNHQ